MYDKNYTSSPPARTKRFRFDPTCSVSVLTDVTEEPSKVGILKHPTIPGDNPNSDSFLDEPSLTDTNLQHDLSPEGFQSASGSPIISSPPTRHPLFVARTKQDRPSPSIHRDTSFQDVRKKCSELNGEREVYADYLESALRNLDHARQQLENTRNTLAEREDTNLDLRVQVRNMKMGMNTAMDHYNAMARELDDMKDLHAECNVTQRSSVCNFFRRSASHFQLRDVQRALSKARNDIETVQDQWQDAHRSLVRTEVVLREQRECMKFRIRALRHTRDELGVVRGQLRDTTRELEDRKVSLDVLRQNNRDLMLEIACLKHRRAERVEARNFTV